MSVYVISQEIVSYPITTGIKSDLLVRINYKSLNLVNNFWRDELNSLFYTLGRVITIAIEANLKLIGWWVIERRKSPPKGILGQNSFKKRVGWNKSKKPKKYILRTKFTKKMVRM